MHSTFLILTSELKTLPPGLVRQRERVPIINHFTFFRNLVRVRYWKTIKKTTFCFLQKSGENFIGKIGSIRIKILVCHTIHHLSPSIVSCKKPPFRWVIKICQKRRKEYFKHVIKSNNIYCTPCPPKS